jgi:transcriptional regulator with XRE-family HTH domain
MISMLFPNHVPIPDRRSSVAISGNRVKEAREKRGISQEKLAQLVGISANQIRRYEKGQGNPAADTLTQLSRVLRVSSDWLLGLTVNPKKRMTKADLSEEQLELLAAWESGDFKRLNSMFWKKDAEKGKP